MRAVARQAAVDFGQDWNRPDLPFRDDDRQGAHERDVGVAVPQRLDGGGVVDGNKALHGDADLL